MFVIFLKNLMGVGIMDEFPEYVCIKRLSDGGVFIKRGKTHAKIVPKRWAVIVGVFLKFWRRLSNG